MIEQVRVTLTNSPGTLLEVVQLLSEAKVDMKALEVSDRGRGQHGEMQVIVSDLTKAVGALEGKHEYEVEEVLAVEMDDRVGGLATILAVLAREKINILQLYAFVTRIQGKSLAVFLVDDPERASKLLAAEGLHQVSRKALEEKRAPKETTLSDHLGMDFIW